MRARHPTRTMLTRHLLLTALAASLLSGLVAAGAWWFARDEAGRSAERVARQVGAAVTVPLSARDFAAGGFDRDTLLADLAPFLHSGMVDRVKVWTAADGVVRLAFSDEQRVEGTTRALDAMWEHRFAGDVAARTVPTDDEHRFENGLGGSRLEVFLGFRDAGDRATALEIYVPVDVAATTRNATAMLLAVVLAGLAVLAVATLPLSVALGRRAERRRREQRAVNHRGLAAAELARRELAQTLHDDVLPELAGIGLLLEAVREKGLGSRRREDVPWELLDHAHELLAGDVRRLRTLLDELVPPTGDLAAALRDVAARAAGPGVPAAPAPTVRIAVVAPAPGPETERLLVRVAGELLRNVHRHADACAVTVEVTPGPDATVVLTVADDGAGFEVTQSRRSGHVGLQLVRRVVEDDGGTVEVVSAPGAGTTVTVTLPAGGVVPATRTRAERRAVRG